MNKAIFYKEWLKTRYYFLAASVVFICYTLYLIIRLNNVVELKGADHLWAILLTRDTIFLEPLQYVPLITGFLMGLVQFIPEVIQKRLKLTLHLPYPREKMLLMMTLSGICQLLPLFLVQLMVFNGFFYGFLASELVEHILLSTLPWYIAGLTAYIWAFAICLEPTWKMRALLIVAGLGVVRIHFMQDVPEAYNSFFPWLALYGILAIALVMRSMYRFKEGCQD